MSETTDTGVSGALTDGGGVSTIDATKFVKDLVLDFLLTAPAVFVALSIANLEQALAAPLALVLGLADAGIRVVYRAALKWAQTP